MHAYQCQKHALVIIAGLIRYKISAHAHPRVSNQLDFNWVTILSECSSLMVYIYLSVSIVALFLLFLGPS